MATPDPSERTARSPNDVSAEQMEGPSFAAPGEMVAIYNFGQPFIIHKEVACYSPVLRAAFASTFVEGQTQTYTLNMGNNGGIDGGLQLLVQWLYGKSFKPCLTQAESESWGNIDNASSFTKMFTKCIEYRQAVVDAWIIADYLQLPRCQNLAADELHQLLVKYNVKCGAHLRNLYNTFPRGNCLMELVFEQCRFFMLLGPYKSSREKKALLPHAFLFDCLIADRADKANPPAHNPFVNREEFKRRFHVPEECGQDLGTVIAWHGTLL